MWKDEGASSVQCARRGLAKDDGGGGSLTVQCVSSGSTDSHSLRTTGLHYVAIFTEQDSMIMFLCISGAKMYKPRIC